MMKRTFTLILAALMALTALAVVPASADTGDWEYEINFDDTLKIVACNLYDAEITVPAEIDGYPVTELGFYLFSGREDLVRVEIPDGVTRIGDSAFEDCTSLKSVKLPSNLTFIENCLFMGCASLESVDIPDGVSGIGFNAFSECTSLTSVSIPSSVGSIEADAFYCCSALSSISITDQTIRFGESVFEDTAYYCNSENWEDGALYVGNHLLSADFDLEGTCKIREGTNSIAKDAFFGCGMMTGVTIPASMEYIGDNAFLDCAELEKVTIPAPVSYIGFQAFYGCSSLTAIDVDPANHAYYSIDGVLFNTNNNMLLRCPMGSPLTDVSIPAGITAIEASAFEGCTALKSVSIPDGVIWLDADVFRGCTSLENVTFPDGLLLINDSVFQDCTSLESIVIPEKISVIAADTFKGCTSLKSVTFPEGLETIISGAFEDCTSFADVVLPDGLKKLGNDALKNTAYYNDDANREDGVLYLGKWLVEAKTDLAGKCVVKDGTSSIADCAFRDRYRMTVLRIPESVTNVGYSAFWGSGLKTVYYAGTEAKWAGVSVEEGNDPLRSALIVCSDTKINYGDMNCDGKINGRDVVTLMKAIVNHNAEEVPASDFARDDKINGKDVISLMKYVVDHVNDPK